MPASGPKPGAFPIASRQRVEGLGLDPAVYASCAEPEQRSIPNRGKVWITKGCRHWYDCKIKDSVQYMKLRDEKERAAIKIDETVDAMPRPRHLKVRHVKPDPKGYGDIVIDNYCSCHHWYRDLARRDGNNGEIAEIIGGEGDTVSLRTSKKDVQKDGSVSFTDDDVEVVIPRFPDPTEEPSMKEALRGARARKEGSARRRDDGRARRLGLEDDVEMVEINPNDPERKARAGAGSR